MRLVPQAPGDIKDAAGNVIHVARLGHLLGSSPDVHLTSDFHNNWEQVKHVLLSGKMTVQIATQIVLTLVGVGISLSFMGVIVWAFIKRKSAPPKTFFPNDMPVGDQIAFNPGTPAATTK